MESEKTYTCLECKKEYNSYMGLWKHKKTKHSESNIETDQESDIIITNSTCRYCKKIFYNSKNRWRHEKYNCKLNLQLYLQIEKTNNIQNNTTTNIQTQNNIQNNNSVTNIQNNTINITFNKLGNEDISVLTQDEIEEIINNGLDSAIKLIEFINFNNDHPQNHTFCTTSLNNKYASVLNTEKNIIEKHRKVDIYDKVLFYSLNHIDMLKDNITNKKKKKEFELKIKDLEGKIYGDVKYKKIFVEQLNALSYNKRSLINNTWDSYFKKYISLIL